MKALVLKEYKHLVFEDVPDPQIASGEVIVAVNACGICGSDVHGFDGSTGRRRPPIIMGHEAAGQIAAIGPGVTGWRPGDRVTFDSTVYCGECAPCREGRVNLCDRRRVLGVSCDEYRQHGAFAELVNVPARVLYKLPDALAFEQAAMVEPVSIAFHAVRRAAPQPGSTAIVVGAGMIGSLIVQALRLAGCRRIIAVDVVEERLKLTRALGATDTFLSGKVDPTSAILELTDGIGADVAFEAVGTSETVGMAVDCARKGGTIVLVGNISPRVEVPLQRIVNRELNLLGSCASCGEYPACLDAMSRQQIQVAPLISAVAPLSDGPKWFQRLYDREPGLIKVVLRPSVGREPAAPKLPSEGGSSRATPSHPSVGRASPRAAPNHPNARE